MSAPAPDRKSVGIWIRVSTEDQARGDSPEHHEKRARAYADSRDWDVVEVYHLEAVSGKSVIEHREARRMLADVRSGRISGVIFSKLARLARNTKELLEFADLFREFNADLISLQESIDTSTPAGRLFYTMIAAMAQWEREEIADRVAASVVIRAKLGKPLNGKIPFGYQWKDRKIEVHPKEGPVRRLIYELFAECHRKRAVARMLNERGYRTRNGAPFTDVTVEHLIRDPAAKGMHRANYTTRRSTVGKKRVLKPKEEWVWTPVEPIVSPELWEECNRYLDDRKVRVTKRPGKMVVHLFAGYTYCTCGRKMYVLSNSPKYVCQTCRTKIPIIDLEAVYYEQLKGFLLSPAEIATQLEKAQEGRSEKEELLAARQAELDKLEREVERIYRLYAEARLDAEGFSQFYKPLQERRRQVTEEVGRLQSELDREGIDSRMIEHALGEARTLSGRWHSLDAAEKRRIVESLTERIVIGDGEVSITFAGAGDG
ncbi:MAG: recombinase family protein [Tepidisphaeraceae bacterium]